MSRRYTIFSNHYIKIYRDVSCIGAGISWRKDEGVRVPNHPDRRVYSISFHIHLNIWWYELVLHVNWI